MGHLLYFMSWYWRLFSLFSHYCSQKIWASVCGLHQELSMFTWAVGKNVAAWQMLVWWSTPVLWTFNKNCPNTLFHIFNYTKNYFQACFRARWIEQDALLDQSVVILVDYGEPDFMSLWLHIKITQFIVTWCELKVMSFKHQGVWQAGNKNEQKKGPGNAPAHISSTSFTRTILNPPK